MSITDCLDQVQIEATLGQAQHSVSYFPIKATNLSQMTRNSNKREEEFSIEENRPLKRVKSEDLEDTVEIEAEVQEPLPVEIAPKYVDRVCDQFDGDGIPDREERTRFLEILKASST